MEKIKISAVSYLNAKPFLFGLENSEIKNDIELSLDIPSLCAEKLLKEEVDLGLVPVAIIPKLNKFNLLGQRACINTDYCIGATDSVKTVCIYSQVSIENVKTVYLDYQSKTSVELAKILFKHFWKTEPKFIQAKKDYEKKIHKTTAGLIIGDRAIEEGLNFEYEYDLAEVWKEMTGLPFVFAAWISNKLLPIDFTEKLNTAFKYGIENIPTVARQLQSQYPANFNVLDYLENNISYEFDEEKKKGMELFLNYIKEQN